MAYNSNWDFYKNRFEIGSQFINSASDSELVTITGYDESRNG